MKTVELEVISDFICPWCYVGKVRLSRIKERLTGEIKLNIRTLPYLLYPYIPIGGLPKADFAKKTKPGMGKSLKIEAEIEGIEINYRHIERIPNSLEAHRLIYLVKDPTQQYRLATHIFQGYFEEGKNIEDARFLTQLGKETGIDKDILAQFTETRSGAAEVQECLIENRNAFISVVPSLRIDQKIILPGLQSKETWTSYIRRAAELQDR